MWSGYTPSGSRRLVSRSRFAVEFHVRQLYAYLHETIRMYLVETFNLLNISRNSLYNFISEQTFSSLMADFPISAYSFIVTWRFDANLLYSVSPCLIQSCNFSSTSKINSFTAPTSEDDMRHAISDTGHKISNIANPPYSSSKVSGNLFPPFSLGKKHVAQISSVSTPRTGNDRKWRPDRRSRNRCS